MNGSELQDFAGEIQTGSAARPRWLGTLPYPLVGWGLAYFVTTGSDGGLHGPNLVFLILLTIWLIYTPVAVRNKWFALRL